MPLPRLEARLLDHLLAGGALRHGMSNAVD
jgi:hypothetical protein